MKKAIQLKMKRAIWAIVAVFAVWSTVFFSGTLAAEETVWTCDIVKDELSPKAVKELKPINLAGPRNGTFSGKIIVETTSGSIKGLKATVSLLKGKDGAIPAQNVQIRYGKFWDNHGGRSPTGADILMETPSETTGSERYKNIFPVWITVKIPKDAKPGIYTGEISVLSKYVKINLEVLDWTLPDTQDYRTFLDFVQSPDSLAVEYNVPLWSEKHWKLIDRSFQLLSPTGTRVVYIPLICGTNFGNEQSMVKWIDKGGGRYDYDYSVLDKYMDSAEKNLGKPRQVIFYVWDICMNMKSLERGLNTYASDGGKSIKENRQALLGKGPRVTAFDPATKKESMIILPRYEDPASKALWQPMFAEVLKRMKARGLEKNNMMLGLMPDLWPTKEEVTFWKDVSGGIPWAIHGHAGSQKDVMIGAKGLYKISDIGYAAFVYDCVYNVNPDKGRLYGWNCPALLTTYERYVMNSLTAPQIREQMAFSITGGQRGLGRLSAEFWYAVKNKNGARGGQVFSRYPENNWRNLDISDWFLAPGPDGALGTARLEQLKEGVEICEARIFLESVLMDGSKKAKIGAELAKRCQAALDEHHRAMWKTYWSNEEDLKAVGVANNGGRDPHEGIWLTLERTGIKKMGNYWTGEAQKLRSDEAAKGTAQYIIGWQDREKKLYVLAGEVEARLGGGTSASASTGGTSANAGGADYSDVISGNTGISKDVVSELLSVSGIKKDDVLLICAAAEITKKDTKELLKNRKKVNTGYDFISELNLEKDEKAKLDALIKKLRAAVK